MIEERTEGWIISFPTKEEISEQLRTSHEGPPVYCYIKDYPPLPGERTRAYQRRVMPLVMAASSQARVEGRRFETAMICCLGGFIVAVVFFMLMAAWMR